MQPNCLNSGQQALRNRTGPQNRSFAAPWSELVLHALPKIERVLTDAIMIVFIEKLTKSGAVSLSPETLLALPLSTGRLDGQE